MKNGKLTDAESKQLSKLEPETADKIRLLLERLYDEGIEAEVRPPAMSRGDATYSSGQIDSAVGETLRTEQQQRDKIEAGRSGIKPGHHGWHELGRAADIRIKADGKPADHPHLYHTLAIVAEQVGLATLGFTPTGEIRMITGSKGPIWDPYHVEDHGPYRSPADAIAKGAGEKYGLFPPAKPLWTKGEIPPWLNLGNFGSQLDPSGSPREGETEGGGLLLNDVPPWLSISPETLQLGYLPFSVSLEEYQLQTPDLIPQEGAPSEDTDDGGLFGGMPEWLSLSPGTLKFEPPPALSGEQGAEPFQGPFIDRDTGGFQPPPAAVDGRDRGPAPPSQQSAPPGNTNQTGGGGGNLHPWVESVIIAMVLPSGPPIVSPELPPGGPPLSKPQVPQGPPIGQSKGPPLGPIFGPPLPGGRGTAPTVVTTGGSQGGVPAGGGGGGVQVWGTVGASPGSVVTEGRQLGRDDKPGGGTASAAAAGSGGVAAVGAGKSPIGGSPIATVVSTGITEANSPGETRTLVKLNDGSYRYLSPSQLAEKQAQDKQAAERQKAEQDKSAADKSAADKAAADKAAADKAAADKAAADKAAADKKAKEDEKKKTGGYYPGEGGADIGSGAVVIGPLFLNGVVSVLDLLSPGYGVTDPVPDGGGYTPMTVTTLPVIHGTGRSGGAYDPAQDEYEDLPTGFRMPIDLDVDPIPDGPPPGYSPPLNFPLPSVGPKTTGPVGPSLATQGSSPAGVERGVTSVGFSRADFTEPRGGPFE